MDAGFLLNNQTRKPTVTVDTFEITDNGGSPASTDGSFRLALDIANPSVARLVGAQCGSRDPVIMLSDDMGEILLIPRFIMGSGAYALPNATISTQPEVRLKPDGYGGPASTPLAKLVYDGGGTGQHKEWEDSNGNKFRVEDIGADADNYPQMVVAADGSYFTAEFGTGSFFGNNTWILDIEGLTGISMGDGDVSDELLFVDTVTATSANRVIQGSGATINVDKDAAVGNRPDSYFDAFWIKVYFHASEPESMRFQHDGGGILMFAVPVQVLIGNRFITVQYSATANTGEELFVTSSGIEADTGGSDSAIGLDQDARPYEVTRPA